ncbi:splicing factor SF3a60 [Tanacetum coccineum]
MHHVRYMIDQIINATHKLADMYEDNDNVRKDYIESLSDGQTFHDRFKEILEYHRRFPSLRNRTHDEYEHLIKEEQLEVQFSREEANGFHLDMHALHNEYINNKLGKQIDYAFFLEEFPLLQHTYLVSFIDRAHSLQDVERLFLKVSAAKYILNAAMLPIHVSATRIVYAARVSNSIVVVAQRLRYACGINLLELISDELFITYYGVEAGESDQDLDGAALPK